MTRIGAPSTTKRVEHNNRGAKVIRYVQKLSKIGVVPVIRRPRRPDHGQVSATRNPTGKLASIGVVGIVGASERVGVVCRRCSRGYPHRDVGVPVTWNRPMLKGCGEVASRSL